MSQRERQTLLLAHREDKRLMQLLLLRCAREDVRVVTPADLSRAGWVHDPHAPQADRMALGDAIFGTDHISAVVTALDFVYPADLPHVHPEDQAFVAAEMTAFLRSWLRCLPCPVIDPPTSSELSGRAGDPSVWSEAVGQTHVRDGRWAPWPQLKGVSIAVVAGHAIAGTSDTATVRIAERLTAAAGVGAAYFTFLDDGHAPALVNALPWWRRPTVATLSAIIEYAGAAQNTSPPTQTDRHSFA